MKFRDLYHNFLDLPPPLLCKYGFSSLTLIFILKSSFLKEKCCQSLKWNYSYIPLWVKSKDVSKIQIFKGGTADRKEGVTHPNETLKEGPSIVMVLSTNSWNQKVHLKQCGILNTCKLLPIDEVKISENTLVFLIKTHVLPSRGYKGKKRIELKILKTEVKGKRTGGAYVHLYCFSDLAYYS